MAQIADPALAYPAHLRSARLSLLHGDVAERKDCQAERLPELHQVVQAQPKGGCHPPKSRPCNFAHFLSERQVPEEMYGDWSKAWENGDVDICFSEDYQPNIDSLNRFKAQFEWERNHRLKGIHVWAWGHADRRLEKSVPEPKDFDWLRLP